MFSLKRFHLNTETDKYVELSYLLYIQAKRYSMVCYVTSQIQKARQCCQYRHNLLGSILFILIEVFNIQRIAHRDVFHNESQRDALFLIFI